MNSHWTKRIAIIRGIMIAVAFLVVGVVAFLRR
jgi:hypothetical protein